MGRHTAEGHILRHTEHRRADQAGKLAFYDRSAAGILHNFSYGYVASSDIQSVSPHASICKILGGRYHFFNVVLCDYGEFYTLST